MNDTPNGERLHIALFGRRNAGKSSLINAITGQDVAIVSEIKGTTTDPVFKAMEIPPLGPVLFIDTPGLDDDGKLGRQRIDKARRILNKTDLALVVVDGREAEMDFHLEEELIALIQGKKIPFLIVSNKYDLWKDKQSAPEVRSDICVSAATGYHITQLRELLATKISLNETKRDLVRDLLQSGDVAVLVVPLDSAAPKGRLILPQQQVIRDVLEAGATAVVCRDTELSGTLSGMKEKPRLVITDSQAFSTVAEITPPDISLTSFSILFSRYKGNLNTQLAGIEAIRNLKDGDCILLAEGCTHHRQCEDIGTVKIPHWLQEFTKKELIFETCSGGQFPACLSPYRLVVHCGGCTLKQKEMAFRIAECQDQNVPIVNYGILIAHLKGVLMRSIKPFSDIITSEHDF